jgi:hypothetical protein
MVPVAATHTESNRALPEPTRLALDADEPRPIIEHEVDSRVLAEGHVHSVAHLVQYGHDREGRAVTLVLRMLHWSQLGVALGWAVSTMDKWRFAYDVHAPE